MSEKCIWTASELRGAEDKTDWERVRSLTDEDIEAAMRDDPEWADLIDFDWADAELIEPAAPTRAVVLELDADVYAFLLKTGDLQPRINGILRHFMNKTKAPDAAE
jgi:uncharacterized protein (DUF4415 family)